MNRTRLSGTMLSLLAVAPLIVGCGGNEQEEQAEATAASAAVIIASPADNQTFAGSFTVRLETRGIEIKPAGTMEPGTGHNHLFVDRDITPVGEAIPTEDGIVHLGMAQTEYTFEDLPPGEHTIIAVVGDYAHVRLANVATDTVHVTIAGT